MNDNQSVCIDMCEQGHKFAKLPDHPKRDGKSRCPHCMATFVDRHLTKVTVKVIEDDWTPEVPVQPIFLEKYGKKVSHEEADKLLSSGNVIIASCNYVLYSMDGRYHYYHAYGTLPGCMRPGPSNRVNRNVSEWYRISVIDLICITGYNTIGHQHHYKELFDKFDECPDWDELDRVLVAAALPKDTLTDPKKNSAFWRKYFNRE